MEDFKESLAVHSNKDDNLEEYQSLLRRNRESSFKYQEGSGTTVKEHSLHHNEHYMNEDLSFSDDREHSVIRSLIAELFSSFFVNFITGSCILVSSLMTDIGRFLFLSLSYGMIYTSVLYTFSFPQNKKMCVAETRHILPNLSLALFVTRRIGLSRCLLNIIFQVFGWLLALIILPFSIPHSSISGSNASPFNVFLLEMFFSFIVILTFLLICFSSWYQVQSTLNLSEQTPQTSHEINCVVIGGLMMFVIFSGAYINPLIPSMFSYFSGSMTILYAYWLGSICGALIAAVFSYLFLHSDNESH